jgi:hypothetical protein
MNKLILIAIFILICCACQRLNDAKAHNVTINNVNVKRKSDKSINYAFMKQCLSQYKTNIGLIHNPSYSETKDVSDIDLELAINKYDGYSVWIDTYIFNNYNKAESTYKKMFKSKPEWFLPLKDIGDIAFLPSKKQCRGTNASILYDNSIILFVINSPELRQPIDLINMEKLCYRYNQIYLDVINDYYSYFIKCSEQAKVPVNPESTK